MKAKGRFISFLLVVNAFFGGYAAAINSRHVDMVDPSLTPLSSLKPIQAVPSEGEKAAAPRGKPGTGTVSGTVSGAKSGRGSGSASGLESESKSGSGSRSHSKEKAKALTSQHEHSKANGTALTKANGTALAKDKHHQDKSNEEK